MNNGKILEYDRTIEEKTKKYNIDQQCRLNLSKISEIIEQEQSGVKTIQIDLSYVTDITIDEFIQCVVDTCFEEKSTIEALQHIYANAFFYDNTEDSDISYSELTDLTERELKDKVKHHRVNWDKLLQNEINNKNRKNVKRWILDKQINSSVEYYTKRTTLSNLIAENEFPEEIIELEIEIGNWTIWWIENCFSDSTKNRVVLSREISQTKFENEIVMIDKNNPFTEVDWFISETVNNSKNIKESAKKILKDETNFFNDN